MIFELQPENSIATKFEQNSEILEMLHNKLIFDVKLCALYFHW